MTPPLRVTLATLVALASACGSSTTSSPAVDAGSAADARPTGDGSTPGDGATVTCPVTSSTEPTVVATDRGSVRGESLGEVTAWRGIPFAAPPTGPRRWRAPEAAACWSGVRDALRFGDQCPQLDAMGAPTGNEDCLTLNVWAPTARTAAGAPVMVFIHGGGHNQGASSTAVGGVILYDGRSLAGLGNVVVTVNYRLGALGFLTHPGLDAESPSRTSGNYALLDQIEALRWVQRNARAFGGDPARVMLFGESAGGANVCNLVGSPLAAGLFSRALIESGGCGAATRESALRAGNELASRAGCATMSDPVACLRALPPERVLMALPQDVTGLSPTDFAPSVDGQVLPRPPLQTITMGMHQRAAFVLGTNSEETYRFLPPPPLTAGQYETAARAFLAQFALPAQRVDAVMAQYPASDFASPHDALVNLTTDVRWTCPARSILRAVRGAQQEPVWRYFFTRSLDPARAPIASRAGAYHALELFYVFGVLEVAGYRPSPADLEVSRAIQGYWSRFAATGDPNGGGAPAWPAYSASTDPYVELNLPPRAGMGVRTRRCDALIAAVTP